MKKAELRVVLNVRIGGLEMKKFYCIVLCVIMLVCFAACTDNTQIQYTNGENDFSIGSTVVFGSYEQDDNYMNGQEEIEWIVLEEENNKVLILSKYVLDYAPYNYERSKVSWENSSVRQWLNSEFKTTAFQEEEQKGICFVTNTNGINEEYGTSSGADTNDEIFLLSAEEYNKYLLNNATAKGIATTWMQNKALEYGYRGGSDAGWWLRTTGYAHDFATRVETYEEIDLWGMVVDAPYGIRPSLWVERSQLGDVSIEIDSNTSIDNDIFSANRGDYVLFGKYEQDGDKSNGMEDIEWLVLSNENGKALLISKYCLDGIPFNTEYEGITWEHCSLRMWLNNAFFENAFDSNEKSLIMTNNVLNSRNSEYPNIPNGNSTEDKIFLLSTGEVETYFDTDEERKTTATVYAQSEKDVSNKGDGCSWWLRTPGGYIQAAATIDEYGSIEYNGRPVDGGVTGSAYGVRPALWIEQ